MPDSHKKFLRDYFIRKISPALVTIILSNNKYHDFNDNKAFLIINLRLKSSDDIYALVERYLEILVDLWFFPKKIISNI